MILDLNEIRPGLVAFLDSEMLVESGRIVFSSTCNRTLQKVRPFLTPGYIDLPWQRKMVLATPLFSSLSAAREPLDSKVKAGPASWVMRESFYDPGFFIAIPEYVFCEASHGDRTYPWLRCLYAIDRPFILEALRRIAEHPRSGLSNTPMMMMAAE